MKHVFILNSHTTYLTAMGVISYLKLEISDIILVIVRNYTNNLLPGDFVIWDASSISLESEKIFSRRNFWKRPKIEFIKKIDATVNSLINDSFHLYAPHLAHPLWTILYTNEKCGYFSYIQEGYIPFTNTYVTKTPIKGILQNCIYDRITNSRVWFYRPWFLRDHIIDIDKVDAFAINNKFFKYLSVRKSIITWQVPSKQCYYSFKEDHMIFVFDAFVSNKIMRSTDYIAMCKKLINENYSRHNYLKFHPGQSKTEINMIVNYFCQKHLQFEILKNSLPFEYVIMTNRNLRLCGYGSSLLYLAHDFGHDVICKDDDLLRYKYYKRYRETFGFISFKEYSNI